MVGFSSSFHFFSKIFDSLVSFKLSFLGNESSNIKSGDLANLAETEGVSRKPSCAALVLLALSSTAMSSGTAQQKDTIPPFGMKETKVVRGRSDNLLSSRFGKPSGGGGAMGSQHPRYSHGMDMSFGEPQGSPGVLGAKGNVPHYAKAKALPSIHPLPIPQVSHPHAGGAARRGAASPCPLSPQSRSFAG